MTVHAAFDAGVYWTLAKYQGPNIPSVQSPMESQLSLQLLAAEASQSDDQQDKIDCLVDFPTELNTSKGIRMYRLSLGIDHPASSLRQGCN